MRHVKVYFILFFILCWALSLALILKEPAPTNASGLARTLFSSPLPGRDDNDEGDNDGHESPPPETTGQVEPGQGGENVPVGDSEAPGFNVVFPTGSVQEPVQVRFFNSGLPQDVPSLANGSVSIPNNIILTSMDSPYFFFAAWRRSGQGGAVRQFNHSIMLNVPYANPGLSPVQEERLRLWMYDPTTQAWLKVGGRVDIFNHVVTGLLASTTPFAENGNTLFALAVDDTPNLEQQVDQFGTTTLSIGGRSDFRFRVLPGTVEVGSHFEVTVLNHVPTARSFQLLAKPVDIKAYYVHHKANGYADDHQLTEFSKPIAVEFDYNAEMLARAGNLDNLTIVTVRDGRWVDVETLGYEIVRTATGLTVNTDQLGTFTLAVKP